MRIVISQPMFLPWVGLFDQVRLADVFVHYDDVQRPQGRSFANRVQVPKGGETAWLTAPIDRERSGPLISQTVLVAGTSWRETHLETLRHIYARQPNFRPMFDLARELYSFVGDGLADFNCAAMEAVAGRIGLGPRFLKSSDLGINGASTARLVSICRWFSASEYITGHGAKAYLDHVAFEQSQMSVHYMRYATRPWPQVKAGFTPFVTILDLLASVPFDDVRDHLCSGLTPSRDFADKDRGVHVLDWPTQ
jgi:WbqC-like protein family